MLKRKKKKEQQEPEIDHEMVELMKLKQKFDNNGNGI